MVAPQRWRAFFLSLILHTSVIGFILWVDIEFAPPAPQRYEVLPIPDKSPDKKIIWYDARKPLPEVRPDRRFGPFETPHGLKDPTRTLIVVSPHPASTHQLIRQPEQPKLLLTDVPAPNLIIVKVKLPPKAFVPPPPPNQPKTAKPTAIEAPHPLDTPEMQTNNALGALSSLQKLPPKVFVPPARNGREGAAAPHVDVPAAPSLDSQSGQVSALDAVMIGLNPSATLPPAGSRSAQIARAPETGSPSSGAITGPNASVVPGLLAHGKPTDTVLPPSPVIPDRRIPQEITLPSVNRTMSAPLRPSSRRLPPAVEARFALRNVYTLAIPGPTVRGYGGDWVMWFAEHDPAAVESRVSAPIPARKYSPLGSELVLGLPVTTTIQFAAVIDKSGHVNLAEVLHGPADPELRRKVLEELGSWEFKPMLHNGDPTDADIVLEIPFRFQTSAQPSR